MWSVIISAATAWFTRSASCVVVLGHRRRAAGCARAAAAMRAGDSSCSRPCLSRCWRRSCSSCAVAGGGSSTSDSASRPSADRSPRQGYAGSFTGVLATVVATPCTAPLMGAAIGFALAQTAGVTFAVFTSVGAGIPRSLHVLVQLAPGVGASTSQARRVDGGAEAVHFTLFERPSGLLGCMDSCTPPAMGSIRYLLLLGYPAAGNCRLGAGALARKAR